MEFLNGRSLAQRLRDERQLEFEDVAAIAMEIAVALDVAHAHGVVHRDLKPANVMAHHYTTGETVHTLIDFGIGNLQRELASPVEGGQRFAATLAYASPEQLTGRATDQRSDVYSFGVTVYELLTGRRPFAQSRPWTVVVDQLFSAPQQPSTFGPDLPSSADAAILKALENQPASRWDTASDFAAALCGAVPSRAFVDSPSPPSRLLDRYTLGTMIARGRLGSEVYEPTDRATNQAVTIRLIRRDQRTDWNGVRTRFLREARTTPIDDPLILRVRDYGDEPDAVYVVTDLVHGRSLRDILGRDAPLPWPRGWL